MLTRLNEPKVNYSYTEYGVDIALTYVKYRQLDRLRVLIDGCLFEGHLLLFSLKWQRFVVHLIALYDHRINMKSVDWSKLREQVTTHSFQLIINGDLINSKETVMGNFPLIKLC